MRVGTLATGFREAVARVTDGGVDTTYRYDWLVQGAIGMVAAQIGTHDMTEASARLAAAATEVGESIHDTARLVLDRRLRLA